jgi:hypothetical protein
MEHSSVIVENNPLNTSSQTALESLLLTMGSLTPPMRLASSGKGALAHTTPSTSKHPRSSQNLTRSLPHPSSSTPFPYSAPDVAGAHMGPQERDQNPRPPIAGISKACSSGNSSTPDARWFSTFVYLRLRPPPTLPGNFLIIRSRPESRHYGCRSWPGTARS